MQDCIFCKIIKGEIPCYKIYEDDYSLAFLDISGDAMGHTLVVPKEHCDNLLCSGDTILSNLILAVKKISKHYIEDCGFEGINILNNNFEIAGQSVFHLHFHIFPRGGKFLPSLTLEEQRQKLMM